ncbi:alpha/beta hydrolase [Chryseobacterium sp. Leaf394]|uniref:alpha/beta fold hydrolase n=1 Tax=Chryseobacterium sp. Leaf394 TaxID=1736361 RepID=UPI0006FFB38C|nr:alpha/beta hydrolase [Chryseobacterium sp. Leaf394]KQS91285.1 hypothetical protein ASG21_02015 [Chryseobacterium sp. Leaf394]
MLKLILNVFIFLFSVIFAQFSGQMLYQIYQGVNVEKYQGKNFILEGKIFYNNEISNSSWIVLTTVPMNSKGKVMKDPTHTPDAGIYYKKGEWSSYEMKGKIDKNAMGLVIGVSVAGKGSYYLDDFKLYVLDGKDKIEIPVKNGDFEEGSLMPWQSHAAEKGSVMSISTAKSFSGKQSLLIDNSNADVKPSIGNNKEVGKMIDINGVKLYYEIYGQGDPLLLIHGNNSSMASFDNQLEVLSKKYQVIGLDSRGQGNSSSDDTKLTYELMADDVNVFLNKMNLKNVNVLGWSDGGNIAVILGMEYPDKVKKMAIMGTVLYNNETSVDPEINKILHQQVKEMKARGVAENNMDYRLKMLLLTEPNINPDALKKIQAPTLVMAGEHDVMPEKHTRLITDKIPNGKMLIFKGGDHEAPKNMPEKFNKAILEFFEE